MTGYVNSPTVCCGLIRIGDGLLLVERGNPNEDGHGLLALPGGYQNGNIKEDIRVAMCREIREETGLIFYPRELDLCDIKTTRDGFNLVFWDVASAIVLGPQFKRHLDTFRTAEINRLVVVTEPVKTAFPLHDEQIEQFFEDMDPDPEFFRLATRGGY
jgi:ADP-ribose pyrophosphatase YjhB (NUDIX family)